MGELRAMWIVVRMGREGLRIWIRELLGVVEVVGKGRETGRVKGEVERSGEDVLG